MAETGLFHVTRFDPTEPAERDINAEKSAFLAKIRARATKRKNEAISQPEVVTARPEVAMDVDLSEPTPEVIPEAIDTASEVASTVDFEIFSDFQEQKRAKISAAFPRWCHHAVKIPNTFEISTPLETLEKSLDGRIFQNLQNLGYTQLFPVQAAIIPELLKSGPKRDYAIQAPTGSGKTIAFLVPILQKLINRAVPQIRALIVLPTRELAQQVFKVLLELTKNSSLKSLLLVGAQNFANEHAKLTEQIGGRTYSSCDIIVCTPGRLVDHIDGGLNLQRVKYLVIDEADRMTGQWLQKMDSVINAGAVQKLLFSATLASDPQFLSALKLRYPRLYTSGWTAPTGLSEEFVRLKSVKEKPTAVKRLLESEDQKALIFTNTLTAATSLNKLLNEMEILSDELSSNLEDWKRKNAIKKFKKGTLQAIVCSDIAARGLDIENCNLVINYDIAPLAANHVHRSGRTARAGKDGKSVTLVTEGNRSYQLMMKELERKYTRRKMKMN